MGSVLILGVFLFIPVWLLVNNYLDSGGNVSLPNSAGLGAPRYNYFGSPVEVYTPGNGNSDLCVTFEFLGVNQATSQTDFGVLVGLTSSGKQMIEHDLGKLKHPPKTGTLLLSSKSGLSNFPVSLSISSLENSPAVSCSSNSNILMSQLDQDSGVRLSLQVFTLGTPRAFPDDWYELDDAVSVTIPDTQQLNPSLIMTSRDEDYAVSASVYKPAATVNAGPDILEFTIRRPPLVIWYTYIIAAMPFLLLLPVFVLKYIRRGDGPAPSEVAFGIAAVLVAILPLHAVLVPSLLPNTTRLDIYFGLGIAFLVAASIIWVVGSSTGSSAKQQQQQGDVPPAGNHNTGAPPASPQDSHGPPAPAET